MSLPHGWPWPAADTTGGSDDATSSDLPSGVNVFGPLAPQSEQQLEAARGLGSSSVTCVGGSVSDLPFTPNVTHMGHIPSVQNLAFLPTISRPQTYLHFIHIGAVQTMQYSQPTGPMYGTAQAGQGQFQQQQMASPQMGYPQVNFPQGHQGHPVPQNLFGQQQMMAQNNFNHLHQQQIPQDNLSRQQMTHYQKMMNPSPAMTAVSPVPSQYQNLHPGSGYQINHNQGGFDPNTQQMIPYSHTFNHGPIQQMMSPQVNYMAMQPAPRVQSRHTDWTQPHASQYRFNYDGEAPFVDITRQVAPSEKPVLVIKNIPYTITHNEILQFLSKSLLPHSLTAALLDPTAPSPIKIHIIMERGTGKTQDCFVEVPDMGIATTMISRVEDLIMAGKPPKMAQRIVNVEISSQGELMKEIFPRAKSVIWDQVTGIPVMIKLIDGFCSGFRGFLTGEELNNVVRFAETPQRSPFAIRCQQRTYEMMMTTLAKFPWASIYYTLEQRDLLFRAYLNQLMTLMPKVFVEQYGGNNTQRIVGLDSRLVASFTEAGLHCPGFNEAQKGAILDASNQNPEMRHVSQFAASWPFECINKPDGVGDTDLGMWLNLLNSGAKNCIRMGLVLAVGEHVKAHFNEQGFFYIEISDEARKSVGFADLAKQETLLMRMMMLHGWETTFGVKFISDEESPFGVEEQTSTTEKKMQELGVYKMGIVDPRHQPADKGKGKDIDGEEVESKDDATVKATETVGSPSRALTESPVKISSQEQGEEIGFQDPFHGRAKSIASDSGFSGMHRTSMSMTQLSDEMYHMEARARAAAFISASTPSSAEKGRPSYAQAPSNVLFNTEMANRPTSQRGSIVSIKSPDGTELDFSKPVYTSASTKYGSPVKDKPIFDPFNTPSRRRSQDSSDGEISPRTKSPKKSYTIKSEPPTRAQPLPLPIGTPSRRGTVDNTVSVGATIDEESDDDPIRGVMMGRRGAQGSGDPY